MSYTCLHLLKNYPVALHSLSHSPNKVWSSHFLISSMPWVLSGVYLWTEFFLNGLKFLRIQFHPSGSEVRERQTPLPSQAARKSLGRAPQLKKVSFWGTLIYRIKLQPDCLNDGHRLWQTSKTEIWAAVLQKHRLWFLASLLKRRNTRLSPSFPVGQLPRTRAPWVVTRWGWASTSSLHEHFFRMVLKARDKVLPWREVLFNSSALPACSNPIRKDRSVWWYKPLKAMNRSLLANLALTQLLETKCRGW